MQHSKERIRFRETIWIDNKICAKQRREGEFDKMKIRSVHDHQPSSP